jgi:23S rRNA (adenine-N6)-dimethyltransferase
MSAADLCSVSQNFLTDAGLAASLVEQSSLKKDDLVVEIGAGRGIITAQLLQRCGRVIAVEKDPALCALLRRRFAGQPRLVLHGGDFRDYPLPRQPYKVFSNLPYHITSAIVERLTASANPPDEACLVMQKEAAEMFLGEPRESLRSILLQPWFELELLHRFRRSDFTTQPRVDSVLLRFRKRIPPLVAAPDRQRFRDFVVFVFTAWRPNLGSALKDLFSPTQRKRISREQSIDLEAKPTSLRFEHWLCLFAAFKKIASPQAAGLVQGSERRLRRQQEKLVKIHRTRKC